MSHMYYGGYPPWYGMPQPPRRRRRRRNIPQMSPESIDDMIDGLKKWQAYQKELKDSEKKPEEKKPSGFEKFQQGVAHLGYLVVLGIPVGLAVLGGYHLLLRGAASVAGLK